MRTLQGVEENLKTDPPCHPAAVSAAYFLLDLAIMLMLAVSVQSKVGHGLDTSPQGACALPVLKAL